MEPDGKLPMTRFLMGNLRYLVVYILLREAKQASVLFIPHTDYPHLLTLYMK